MKKGISCGITASLLLVALQFSGCADNSNEEKAKNAPSRSDKVAPKISIEVETEKTAPVEQAPDIGSRCNNDSECGVIPEPSHNCIPCHQGGGQKAVTIAEAKEIMAPHKAICKPKIEEMMRSGQQPQSQHHTCSFNGAKCIEGFCQLANLSQSELQQRQAQHGGQQGGQPLLGQGGHGQQGYAGGNALGKSPWGDVGSLGSLGSASNKGYNLFDRNLWQNGDKSSWANGLGGQNPWGNLGLGSAWGKQGSGWNGQNPWGNYGQGASWDKQNPWGRLGQGASWDKQNLWGNYGQQGASWDKQNPWGNFAKQGLGLDGQNPWSGYGSKNSAYNSQNPWGAYGQQSLSGYDTQSAFGRYGQRGSAFNGQNPWGGYRQGATGYEGQNPWGAFGQQGYGSQNPWGSLAGQGYGHRSYPGMGSI